MVKLIVDMVLEPGLSLRSIAVYLAYMQAKIWLPMRQGVGILAPVGLIYVVFAHHPTA